MGWMTESELGHVVNFRKVLLEIWYGTSMTRQGQCKDWGKNIQIQHNYRGKYYEVIQSSISIWGTVIK